MSLIPDLIFSVKRILSPGLNPTRAQRFQGNVGFLAAKILCSGINSLLQDRPAGAVP